MENLIQGELYQAEYDAPSGMVALRGVLRLNGAQEYAPIVELLTAALEQHAQVTVDLSELEFLNSSGIAMLSKFVIEARNRKTVTLTILGAQAIAWQGKSLVNLQRLMPAMQLDWR